MLKWVKPGVRDVVYFMRSERAVTRLDARLQLLLSKVYMSWRNTHKYGLTIVIRPRVFSGLLSRYVYRENITTYSLKRCLTALFVRDALSLSLHKISSPQAKRMCLSESPQLSTQSANMSMHASRSAGFTPASGHGAGTGSPC